MGVYNRPNGTADFTNDPNVDPATGAKFDAELNGLTSTINAIDNANIAATPKIDGTKVNLTTTGFLALSGGTMTGTIAYSYDGIWHEYRAAGNARVRTYRGSDGAEWGISYNTKWDEGTGGWLGRDVIGTATVLKVEADGISVYSEASAGAGVAPVTDSTTERFRSYPDNTIGSQGIKTVILSPYTAGSILLVSSDVSHDQNVNTTFVKMKEIVIARGGTLRIEYTFASDLGVGNSSVYRNGTSVGTNHGPGGPYTEDITGWNAGDAVQIWVNGTGLSPIQHVTNFRIYVADTYLAGTVTLA